MGITKPFALFILLLSAAYATSVSADITQGISPQFHFSTDISITTSFTMSANSTTIVQSGDTVCNGTTLTISPAVDGSKWAVSSLDILSIYPSVTTSGFYPVMIPDSTLNSGQSIRWLPASTYDGELNFVGSNYANEVSQSKSHYNNLAPFDTEPMSYDNGSGPYTNKEGGAEVYCKGTLNVMDGSTPIGSYELPATGTPQVMLTAGTHQISTSISGIDCFAATVKHPDNIADNPSWFYYYYYTANRPTFGSGSGVVGVDTVTINVKPAGGNCALAQTEIDSTSVPGTPGISLVHVTVKNNGDPVTMDSVSSSDPGFTVSPFPTTTCDVLGFPSSVCPSDNGFNEIIPSGGSKDLYVLMQNNGGTSTTLTFNSTVAASSSCSGGTSGSSCSFTTDMSSSASSSCTITPASLTYGTDEVAKFTVSCEDLTGNTVPCTGDDWFWTGISGDFIEKDNTQALAYPTSAPGASGTLGFRPASGTAACYSDIDVTTPDYVCKFDPPNADLNYSQSQPFVFSCLVKGTPQNPDSTTYSTNNGLQGTLSNQSNSGVTYTAPEFDTKGDLIGFGQFDSAPSPILGAIADAPITVTNGSTGGNQTNTTTNTTKPPGNCPACVRNGDTNWCQMSDDLINVFTGYSGWIGLKCGQYGNETCDQATWSVDPSSAATFSDSSSPSGVTISIIGAKGTTGIITVSVNGKSDQTCTRGFAIGDRACWEIS